MRDFFLKYNLDQASFWISFICWLGILLVLFKWYFLVYILVFVVNVSLFPPLAKKRRKIRSLYISSFFAYIASAAIGLTFIDVS